jgi:uncharacterized phage protein (TIGR02218 family)
VKTISTALKNHLAQPTTTLSTVWKIIRRDGQVFGFTDHDRDIVYEGITYHAATGHTPSAIQTTTGLAVDNLEVTSLLDSSFIKDADLIAGLWDYAEVTISLLNWVDTSMGALLLRRGRLGEVTAGKVEFTAELRGLGQNLQQEVGRLILPGCNADLGDTRCKITLGNYTAAAAITTVNSASTFTASALTQAAGYFTYGKVSFTSGANTGLGMEVKTHAAGGVITLQQPMPYPMALGDAFNVSAGCDKSTGAGGCGKFSNIVNFRGFPAMPGRDRMVSGK